MRRLAAVLLVTTALYAQESATPQQLWDKAAAARKANDSEGFLAAMQPLATLRPNHPAVIANYVSALAMNAMPDAAIVQLRKLAAMQVAVDLADKSLDPLRARADFQELANSIAETRTRRIGSGEIAFRFPSNDLITEAIVRDPTSGDFLVTAAAKRKVLRIAKDGKITEWLTSGVPEGNGIGVDPARGVVWVSGASGLVAFNLENGERFLEYKPAEGQRFDDLTVGSDGVVYLSDAAGAVLRLHPDEGALETLVPRGTIRSAQGSALSADGKTLFVADYSAAIFAVDVKTGAATRLSLPSDFAAFGIDGLELHGDSLIAIQNGIVPNRIVRLTLSRDGSAITGWKILEMNHPLMDEPTLGVVVGREFYALIGSQRSTLEKKEKGREAVVLKVRL